MKQLTQILKTGEMQINDVPIPTLQKGMVLVRNHFSLISAGTEGSTVKTARKSLIGKAKERPQQVKQVIDTFQKLGPVQTYRAVMKKLDAYSPLGYSSAGEVIGVGEGVSEFRKGDKVACAGVGYANHAEVISVPVNLCAKLNYDADLLKASYNTLGAIAMQGVRQADLRVGESCAIIGLGLIGQLTSQILNASGVKTFGIDISQSAVDISNKHSTFQSWIRNTDGLSSKILEMTNGQGVDAVIITAGSSSLDPINFAGEIARKKGKVIVVGAVPTGFDRDPYYYKKELELKMSCSYGPGRYDLNYEEKEIDYPYPYVRWTEKRNMEAFQHLLHTNAINIDYLTTHEFAFDDAPKAFDMVVNKTESFIGIALKYDISKNQARDKIITSQIAKSSDVKISFIGAGSYAQGNLLPNIPEKDVDFIGVLTSSGTTSKRVAEKYKFKYAASKEEDVLNEDTNTLFIATRHDTHAEYVIKGLKSDKNIFVEKPLCLKKEELKEITSLVEEKKKPVMIGFNRRFSPLTKAIKNKFGNGPMSMIYRVNAGAIPKESWIQDMEIGGGRILGEACHFIDYLTYINGSLPVAVSANAIPDPHGFNDTVNILLQFENGSTGVVAYYANGPKSLSKEYFEIYSAGSSAMLFDFKELKIYGKGKLSKKKLINQNKGQKEMTEAFINGLKNGKAPISYQEVYAVTSASFAVLDSLREGGKQIKV